MITEDYAYRARVKRMLEPLAAPRVRAKRGVGAVRVNSSFYGCAIEVWVRQLEREIAAMYARQNILRRTWAYLRGRADVI